MKNEKQEIIFIDAGILNLKNDLLSISPTAQIVFLDTNSDALSQIAAALQAQQNLDAIHIISHGSSGELNFSNGLLNSENLSNYAPLLEKIGQSLSENGDILLYGCDIAKDENFINLLAKFTHADIAASHDLTGASALGGNWDLEVHSGKIEVSSLSLPNYQGLLAQNLINGLGGLSGFGENDYVHEDDPMQSPGIDITSIFGASGVKFGTKSYTTLFINNNGIVTFGEGTKIYIPNGLKDGVKNTGASSPYLPTLALYWTDLDTRAASTTVSAGGTSTGANLVHWDLDTVNKKITITWNDVAEYSHPANSTPVLAAQMILTDAGDGNMNIEYRYEYVAELKTHTATAGWNAGVPNGIKDIDYFEIPLNTTVKLVSGKNVTALSDLDTRVGNSGQDGIFQFFLRNGGVVNKALSYDITTFVGAGTGTVANTATLTLVGDTFSAAIIGTTLPASRITNLPNNLNATLTIVNATTATLSFAPTLARAFSDADDRSNVTVSFINSDFTGGSAAAITGATTSNLLLDFPNITPTFVGGINDGLTLLEDAGATTISNAVLKVYDPDTADAQLTYTVTALPTKGTLTNNGVTLTVNSTFTQADINNGLLKFTPTANQHGSDNFQFEVRDGVALSVLSNQTFNFSITAVNDPHTGKPAFSFAGALESGKVLTANLGTLVEIDEVLSSPESSRTIQWQVSADNATWFDIAGATGINYTLGSPLTPTNEQGKYLRVKLNWGNGDFAESEVSNSQAIVFTPPNLAGITAGTSVIEPVALSTTQTNSATPVSVFDFTIHDGVSDGKVTTISQIVLNTSGTADFTKVAWLLTGNDIAGNVAGVYNSGANTLTFTGLNISVADTQNETYVVKAYYTSNTNLTEGQTYILSLSPNTGVTVGAGTTQLQLSQPAVTNDAGTAVSVLATQLVFDTQPAGSTSGAILTTQPVLKAVDAVGNLDTDFIASVSLTENSAGALSGTVLKEASAGIITFNDILYTATADHEAFQLTASTTGLTSAVSNTINSDVVATKLQFSTQPAPTLIESGKNTAFTTVPIVQAVDAQNVLDVDYVAVISLAVTDPVDGVLDGTVNSLTSNSVNAAAGLATFTGLSLQYTSASANDNLAFQTTSGGLTAANSQTITASFIPTVTAINRVSASPTNAGVVDFTLTFSESVSGVDASDFALSTSGISGATIISVSGSGANYTVSVNTGSGDGTLRLDLNDDDSILSATNIRLGGAGLGNGNFSSGQTYLIDKTPPTISINTIAVDDKIDDQEDNNSIVISGTTSGAEDGQIVTVNFGGMTKIATVSSNLWSTSLTSAEIQSFSDSTISVNAAVSDAVGNAATLASRNVIYNKSLPTSTITSSDYVISRGETATITFTFSEAVTGFTEADLTVGNGSISTPLTINGGLTWTAIYTPTVDVENASNVITVDNSGVEDNAHNKGVGVTNSPNYSVDTRLPTVANIARFIPSDAITNADALTFRITFSEAVQNVDANDFVVTGTSATISSVNAINANTYDVTLSGGDLASLNGSAQIGFSTGQNIVDNFNNPLTNLVSTGSNQTIYTLDNFAAAPNLALVSDTGSSNVDAITSNGNLAVSNLETGATWQFSSDNGVTWQTGTGNNFTVSGDGNKSVQVKQTDLAGNVSAAVSLNFVLDTTIALPTLALAVDSNINGDLITNNGTVTVSNLENGVTWQFSSDNGATWQTGTGNNFAASGDGNKTVQVKQTDLAGNVSATASLNFVLDTTVALPNLALAIDSNINNDLITNNGTVTVSNLENGATWQFSSDNGVTWQTGTGNNFTVSGDGNKTVQVKQTDLAGNVSSVSSLNFVLDTTVALPTLELAIDSNINNDLVTNNGTVTVANLETGATWQFSSDNGVTWQTGTGNNFTVSGDGNKTVQVKQTDLAGNVSAAVSLNFVLDTIVAMPNLALAIDSNINGDLITNNGTVTVSNLETGASWQFSSDNGVTWQAGTGNNFTVSGDGNKTVQVKQTDLAGNVSSAASLNFVLDTIVAMPNLALAIDSNINGDLITNNGTVTVSNLENGATWQFSSDNGVTWQTGTGNNFTVSGDGNKTVQVKQTDLAGNVSAAASLNFVLDTTIALPNLALAIDSNINGDLITNNGTVTVANLENGANWQFSSDNGVTWQTGTSNNFTVSGDGNKTVQVKQTDLAGNVSANAALNFVLDTTIALPALALAVDSNINGDLITNNGTVTVSNLETGASWQFSEDNGTTWQTGTGNNFAVSGDGNKSVQVKQTDLAGNVSATASLNFVLDTTVTLPNLALAVDSNINGDLITNNGTVTVANLETGASWQFSKDNGVTWQTGTGNNFVVSGDGNKTVQVKQTDLAGNISATTSLNFLLDTVIATPTLQLEFDSGISAIDKLTNNGTVLVSGLEAGAKWQWSSDNINWISGDSDRFTLTNDGNHQLFVRQTDIAGNVSDSAKFSFTLDTKVTPPALSLAKPPVTSNLTTSGEVIVSGLENQAVWQFSLDAGKTWQPGTGNNLTLNGDGEKIVIVRQIDPAGNISINSEALTFTLDTTALMPMLSLFQDTGKSVSDRITNNGTVNVSGIEKGANWEFSSDNLTWFAGGGIGVTLTGDGEKAIFVRQIDPVGNISPSNLLTFILDTKALLPNLKLVQDTGKNGDLITRDGTVEISNLENSASWQFSTDDGKNWTIGSGNRFTLYGDGEKNVLVSQTDLAGNSAIAAFSFLLDSQISPLSLTLARDTGKNGDLITSDGKVNVSGLEPFAIWEYSLDGGKIWQTGQGDSLILKGDGEKSVLVKQTDLAGNTSPVYATLNFLLDSRADMPFLALESDTGKNGDLLTRDGRVNVLGLENGATWRYSTDSGATWTQGSGNQFELFGDGNKTVIVKQTDIAGNENPTSMVLNFTLDTTVAKPSAVLTHDTGNRNDDFITRDGTFDILNLEKGATWRYSFDNGKTWQKGGEDHLTLKSDGNKTVLVSQTDLAGNESEISLPLNFLLDTKIAKPILKLDTKNPTLHAAIVSNIEDGASWEFSANGIDWTQGAGNQLIAANEIKSVLVRQTDIAGNVSDNSRIGFLPDVPTLTLLNDSGRKNNDFVTSDGRVGVSDLESGYFDWQYSLDNEKTWTKGTGFEFTLTGDGVKNIVATQIDSAGNRSVYDGRLNFLLDTIALPPKITLIHDSGKPNDLLTNDGSIFVENLENGATWQFSLDNGKTWKTGVEQRLSVSGDGVKTVLVRQTDIAGNLSDSASLTFTLDTKIDLPKIALQIDSGKHSTDKITNQGTVVVSNI